jgi:DNA-binding transcriptional LysR family regulator
MAIFAKTIDHGSFRGAAKELRLSPSVVSHHISQLEEHLGVALMYRTTRKLTLTQEGERLLFATQKMLDAAESEINTLTANASEPSGQLRITAPSVLSQSPFTDMIATFLDTYPRIELVLDFSDERKRLIDDRFDLAIRMSITTKKSPTTRKLYQVGRKVVASKAYLQRHPTAKTPDDIKDWKWLELTPVRHEALTFEKDGKQKQIHRNTCPLTCNDAQALYRLVQASAGIAVVPEFLATNDVADGKVAYPIPDWSLAPIVVYAEWPTNAPKNGLIHLLVKTLTEQSRAI